jgi:hypothetical protein
MAVMPVGVFADDTPIPNLVCQTADDLFVSFTERLEGKRYEPLTQTLYRFSEGALYLSTPEIEEYKYGDVTSSERLRYAVGYKAINFTDESYRVAYDVHTDWTGATIRRLDCVRVE